MWHIWGMDTTSFVVNERDMKRYQLMHKVMEGKLSLTQAAQALGLSYRQVKRLKAKAARGLEEMSHGNRGRTPINKTDATLQQRVLELSGERYFDFNDSHFCQQLAQNEGITLSRELVRRWRREAGIAPQRKRRPPRHRKRRPRKAAEGLMMLWDGSPHRWFGSDSPPCCLMAAIDDATGKIRRCGLSPMNAPGAI